MHGMQRRCRDVVPGSESVPVLAAHLQLNETCLALLLYVVVVVCVVSVVVNYILSARVVLSLCRLCRPAACRKE